MKKRKRNLLMRKSETYSKKSSWLEMKLKSTQYKNQLLIKPPYHLKNKKQSSDWRLSAAKKNILNMSHFL